MPKKLEYGSSEVIVKTIEVGGTKVENLSLQEVTEEGSTTNIPITINDLTLNEENTQVLFSDGKKVKGTPNITHNKTNKLTNILGKLKLSKSPEDTKVGVVTENNTKSVGVVLDDNDILSISYVNSSTLETDSSVDLPLRIHGNTTITKKLNVGTTLSVDDNNESTVLTGNTTTNFLNVDQLLFNNNNLYISPKTVSASCSSGTLTVNCNFAPFGRCVASGTLTGTLSTYTFNNMLQGSRMHVLLPEASTSYTLSSTITGGVFRKGEDLTVDIGDYVLLEIENINDTILISPILFS